MDHLVKPQSCSEGKSITLETGITNLECRIFLHDGGRWHLDAAHATLTISSVYFHPIRPLR